jgi:hypothetical protein
MFVSAVGILAESLLKVTANLVALLLLCLWGLRESLEMLEMDWGDNRKIVHSAKHVVVVASGEVESCNSGSDAGARIALEVTHKVGKLVDIRERSSCYFIDFSEKIIQAHNILCIDVEFLELCCESVKIHGVVENIFCIASFEVFRVLRDRCTP